MFTDKANEKLKQDMQSFIDAGKYEEALQALAGATEMDDGMMYQAAYCYFMLGDYGRSAQWVQNSLNRNPSGTEARLLLARLCILQERAEDGLAIYEHVLSAYAADLTEAQQSEMGDILSYYVKNDAESTREKYPHIAQFAAHDMKVTEEQARAAGQKEITGKKPAGGADGFDAKLQEILAQPVSAAQKIRILNAFAGALFAQGDLQRTERYLSKALELDAGDAMSLRNAAILKKKQGDPDKALQLAASLPETDFLLLAYLC